MAVHKSILFFILVFISALKLAATTSVFPEKSCTENCPDNEEYSECGNNGCQNTCANPKKSWVCKAACMSGCVCVEDYLRNSGGICVPVADCDTCGENEIFSECDNHGCRNTCAEPNRITYCDYSAGCYPGCICADGYLRNDEGKCVPQDLCEKKCGENELYTPHKNHPCRDTCSSPDLSQRCRYIPGTYPGCICIDGFLKNNDGVCVPREECVCKDPNAEMVNCPNPCPGGTCESPKFFPCKMKCQPRGCQCKKGFVKDKDGYCILLSACPKKCTGKNTEYNSCGTACPLTCDNFYKDFACTRQCVPGCFCKKGYVLDKNKDCVLKEKCPIPTCGANEVYNKCPPSCPPEMRCYYYFNDIQVGCPAVAQNTPEPCFPRCRCKPNYMRSDWGTCVLPKNCCADKNAEVVNCPSPCPGGTCQMPSFMPCKRKCNPKGCQCKKGYLKKSDTDATCVPSSLCKTTPCPTQ